MTSISKRRYTLLALWVIGASALGIYLVRHFSPPLPKDTPAPEALTHQCGPKDLSAEEEQKLAAAWIANPKEVSDEAKRAVVRVVRTLPERVISALRSPTGAVDKVSIKITLDQGKWPYVCTEEVRSSSRFAITCLKNISGVGRVLVLGRSSLVSADGRQRQLSDQELVDQSLLPALFWLSFERLGSLRDEKPVLPEPVVSKSNVMSRIKQYVVDGYKFSPEEETFYMREFGGSGTKTPAFVNRTVALTGSQIYCDAESYERLNKNQPEAVKRYMSAFGCSLGRAWYMDEGDFSGICPTLAASGGGLTP
jgi:hypothetical protein